MSKKIKVELTEKQFFAVSSALHSHCLDIMGAEFIDPHMATENRVISNAIAAMDKGHKEWKASCALSTCCKELIQEWEASK